MYAHEKHVLLKKTQVSSVFIFNVFSHAVTNQNKYAEFKPWRSLKFHSSPVRFFLLNVNYLEPAHLFPPMLTTIKQWVYNENKTKNTHNVLLLEHSCPFWTAFPSKRPGESLVIIRCNIRGANTSPTSAKESRAKHIALEAVHL